MAAQLLDAALLLCAVAPGFSASMNVTEWSPEASCPYALRLAKWLHILLFAMPCHGLRDQPQRPSILSVHACPWAPWDCRGVCQSKTTPCSSAYRSGLCPGDSSILCCPEATPKCTATGGQCQQTTLPCTVGTYTKGLCPGAANVQCCHGSTPQPGSGGPFGARRCFNVHCNTLPLASSVSASREVRRALISQL
jgi:hypothetical protein|eukprot:COSAG02_NODE_2847_length_7905_cov_3.444017_1_plen_194_part_00